MEKNKKPSTKELGKQLAQLQRQIIQENIPVIILVDGWENSGKGDIINKLTRELDPRYYSVAVFDDDWATEQTYNYMYRFWRNLPKQGHITFYDRSLYFKAFDNVKDPFEKMAPLLEDIYGFIRMLVDDGTIIIKLFLDMSHEEQKKRLESLEKIPFKKLFLTDRDYDQEKKYDLYADHFKQILERTNQLFSTWQVIPTDSLKHGGKLAMEKVAQALQTGLEAYTKQKAATLAAIEAKATHEKEEGHSLDSQERQLPQSFPSAIPHELFIPMEREEYDTELAMLQEKARLITFMLYICGISTICAFEGQDAAGKGGAIKRLTKAIDPRGYDIHQTAAPCKEEKSYHYMRRFMINTPPMGKIAIFDRTWYGRVLVERIEGFATEAEWKRAYQEINTMEQHWVHSGINLMKFFIAIDNDEQLRRFQERQNTPEKQFKITDEDWRNRDKWDQYSDAFQEMFYRTSTGVAPWTIVEGNNKLYARIKVLRTFVTQCTLRLKHFQKKHPKHVDWDCFWNELDSVKMEDISPKVKKEILEDAKSHLILESDAKKIHEEIAKPSKKTDGNKGKNKGKGKDKDTDTDKNKKKDKK